MNEELTQALATMFAEFEKKLDAKYGKPEAKKPAFLEKDGGSSDGSSSDGSSDGSSDMPQGKGKKAKAEASVLTALVEANAMVAQLTAKIADQNRKAFEARVSESVVAGKLLPSQKAWALTLDEEAFDDYLAAVGDQVFPVGKEHKEDTDGAKAHAGVDGLSAEEKKLAAQMGHSEADVIAYNKAHPRA